MLPTALGESQRSILDHLKRNGSGTIPELAEVLDLNVETVRSHLRSLGSQALVRRQGRRRSGPGRPGIVYALTEEAEALFPSREGEILHDLAAWLEAEGERDLLGRFFHHFVARRRARALARVEHLEGDERLDEVARILTEEGFMAEVRTDDADRRVLRLCHCPMRSVVEATRLPCKVELGFVRELLGERLARVSYIPAGDASCSYGVAD